MADAIVLQITGRRSDKPEVPSLLRSTASRAVGAERTSDEFLPPGLLEAKASIDLTTSARGLPDSASTDLEAGSGQVLVLELADGGTLITSPEGLNAALLRNRPDLVAADGRILFDRMNAEGAVMQRGLFASATGSLVSQVISLAVGRDPLIDAAQARLAELMQRKGKPADIADAGASWLATKALMWAVEERLARPAGHLYRWDDGGGQLESGVADDTARMIGTDGKPRPALVFIHGTGSSTLGSFGDLQRSDRGLWARLESRFPGGIYGFEHRTLSQSPIENALQLATALPRGARISLVTHSRGGLVGDLLCLQDIDQHVDSYSFAFQGVGDAQGRETEVRKELDRAHAEHREQLRALFTMLRDKAPVIDRYVRVAAPAQGTRLASGNFDVFLSGLLTLIGRVPYFFGNPLYSAFKRVVIEVAKNRTNPHLVPGLEAMLPDSPMAALLRDAAVQPGIRMALIAGDIQGGNLLMRMGVLLTDFLLFENTDNDLVVDTAAMLAGVAAKSRARVMFDRAADVSHFNYFGNLETRNALRDWLVADETDALDAFRAIPDGFTSLDAAGIGKSRSTAAADRPVVVVLPGVMGTYLDADGKRVWLDPLSLAGGALQRIAFGAERVTAGELFGKTYGDICEHLADSHRVLPFPYDWRQPLDVLGERLGTFLDLLLKQTAQPVRLLAHSMGGLVVRACIHRRRDVMDALMQRDGARLIMAGTPHQGSHSMVENLLGKGNALRALARLDFRHDMQDVLDIVSGFRGALQLLPAPGFVDTFQGQPEGGEPQQYWEAESWKKLKALNTDLWFGDQRCGQPDAQTLASAGWLWTEDAKAGAAPGLPLDYQSKSIYVFGVAPSTPCGLRVEDRGGKQRLRMVSTTRGDGTVTWDSGRIGNIGSFYYLPAVHGDLLSSAGSFAALGDLLVSGSTARLDRHPPTTRAATPERPRSYDPGPPNAIDDINLAAAVMGGTPGSHMTPRAKLRLEVRMKAMDLRFLACPILVGHYENDSMAGTEALIDSELMDGQLAQRKALDLYAGPLGTAAVVLRAPSALDRRRGVLTGAVVTGLGRYEGSLSQESLMLAVRAGVLRYLLQVVDVMGREDREVPLATLLLGYNSSANLTIAASVEALVRGVIDANERFKRTTGLSVRVAQLDIVELYLDTAITAVYELRQLTPRLADMATAKDTQLACSGELVQGIGLRQRLFDTRGASYWPRLIVTDADDQPGAARPEGGIRLANRLRFLYVGQRARAETVVQQRQPSLIETLVRQQISQTHWNSDFGRMLFQLIVPPDFKDAARQLQRIVLVVDAATANLPWELMLTDPLFTTEAQGDGPLLPLSLCTPVVRQLSSTAFRRDVRQSLARSAYVIGNPSVQGFAAAFPDPANPERKDPDALAGAEVEATAIAGLFANMGYEVSRAIGDHNLASDVLAKLYRKPYRIVHVSAHGVFEQLHADGLRRSGVVLSGGLLITAAEIAAMESVPELVFLNCCHLGQIAAGAPPGPTLRDGNKLAASVARELMDIGVRCVVVAGWAVDDKLAQQFGEVFYQSLLQDRRPFGNAVFEARQALWAARSDNVTWGAFQAYGDPLWLAETDADGAVGAARGRSSFVSLDEMLDELARARVEASRRPDRQLESERQARIKAIEDARDKRCPPGWLRLPALQSALGATWRELGCLEQAQQALQSAIQSVDLQGRVPIRDIEQLAAVEIELGAVRAAQRLRQPSTDPGVKARGARQGGEGLALIANGIERLLSLDKLVSQSGLGPDDPVAAVNSDRHALLAGAHKRTAVVFALQLLQRDGSAAQRARWREALAEAAAAGVQAYTRAQGLPGDDSFRPYPALHGLALRVVLDGWDAADEVSDGVAMARQCGMAVSRLHALDGDPWDVVMSPEALLVERLRDGGLAAAGSAGESALGEVLQAYRAALEHLGPKVRHVDRTVEHLEMLATLFDARFLMGDGEGYKRMADGLLALVGQLRPGRETRPDRPEAPAPAPP
ncbi:CHAT domain-containing protein [Variovorax saccharolyticus]|uniref:CHAT domain-containing protein n=1 Tax=Variovorax saccharolyticus TaxID=3053516 RepID=UPI002575C4F0|nr:CHAT domain-containing protein [Variovorax sp. J31P216]MDM0024511.1 CHAT domain-containing protein [Variovorax sp. J31P216]